jgi:trans-2,3-dihydro-3-hydroxyanthranilate isomerase
MAGPHPAIDVFGELLREGSIAMKRRFATLDVFTDRRFAGNPLAVVLDGVGLEEAAMQAIALEFNLSETVFILPAQHAAHRARYRIFTPRRELPFAGHPTVGAAVLLARLDGGDKARDMILEANIGPVPCRVAPVEAYASFDLPALPEEIGSPSAAPALAAALGLAVGEIGFGDFAPCCWSAGVPYTFVPLKSLDAVRRAKPDLARFAALDGPQSVFVFTSETAEPGHHFHARMFAPSFGIIEDPATGSAAAAFAGVLARFGGLKDGSHAIAIEQGYEMGRPSLMHLSLTLAGGALTAASIGGNAVVVSEGTIET